jgi:ferredoxin
VPTIEFLESAAGPPRTAEGEGPLIDICDEARAPVEFSCRSASCGTCRVEVLAGGDLLEPARDDELELLRALGAPPRQRLACQAIARPGPGLVRLRWVSH